jgi:two-component system chemotaxis response regulator CheV
MTNGASQAARKDILTETGTNELELIEFFLDHTDPKSGETERSYFGVNVAKVWEVIESPRDAFHQSAANPCFLGTIPLRDVILPVLDLARWLDLDKQDTEHEVILVTEFNKCVSGFLVSGVTQIHRVGWDDVEPPSHYLAHMRSNCITGMVRMEDHFVLMLDLEKVLSELNPEFAGTDAITTRAQQNYKALIADDSTTLRYLIKQNLEQANFAIETHNDGEEAWNRLQQLKEQAREQGKKPSDLLDIIISDIEMPRMDGYHLTKRIKDDPDLKELPVILFSSLITEKIRHKGQSVGADDQISKPEFNTLAQRAIGFIERTQD